jgi:hypothetical protein
MSDITALKRAFQGKTIAEVQNGSSVESICTFKFTDGTTIRLRATELGYWIDELPDANGKYKSFSLLAEEYRNHYYHQPDMLDSIPNISISEDGILTLSGLDGTKFYGDVHAFPELEKAIVSDPVGVILAAECASLGDCWIAGVGMSEDIPDNLKTLLSKTVDDGS